MTCLQVHLYYRRVMDRLLRDRDAAVEADPTHTGLPQAFVDWT